MESSHPASRAHGATVAHVVETLRRDILHRKIAPGSRLIEADLTRRFAVSRGPVREAFRRLAAEGLIDLVPHRGAIARRLSTRDIAEVFEIRIALESLAARRAAEVARQDAAQRTRFEARTRPVFANARRSLENYFGENAEFHAAVYELAGNALLGDLAQRLHLPQIMGQVGDALSPQVLQLSVNEHRAIAAAILAGDADGAASAMEAHLKRAAALARFAESEQR